MRRPDLARGAAVSSHERLAGVRRREAAFEQRAALRQLQLVVDRKPLRGELRMGDDDVAHAGRGRRVDEHEDLVAREMPGGEHHAVARDHGEHLVSLR